MILNSAARSFLRFTAFVTLIFFCSTQIDSSWAGSLSVAESKLPVSWNLEQSLANFLPAELGSLDHFQTGKRGTLFHIQTAHGHYEAHERTEKILKWLHLKYGAFPVFLEGASDKLDAARLDFFKGHSALNLKNARWLAKSGYVTGPELFLMQNRGMEMLGIENAKIYRSNHRQFADVLLAEKEAQSFISIFSDAMEKASVVFSPELRSFLKRLEQHELGNVPPEVWLDELSRAAKKYLKIDFSLPVWQLQWPMLVRYFKILSMTQDWDSGAYESERQHFLALASESLGNAPVYRRLQQLLNSSGQSLQLPEGDTEDAFIEALRALPRNFPFKDFPHVEKYIGILLLRSELNPAELNQESARLEDMIAGSMVQSEQAGKMLEVFKDYRLLEKLLNLKVTPQDFDIVLKCVSNLKPSAVWARIQGSKLNLDWKKMDAVFEEAVAFYQGALKRDQIMIAHMEARLKKNPPKFAVVITGGFHAEAMRKHFEKEGYAYGVVTPSISGPDEKGYEAYLRIMANGDAGLKTGADQIELARPSGSLGSGTRQAALAATVRHVRAGPQFFDNGLAGSFLERNISRSETREIQGEKKAAQMGVGSEFRVGETSHFSFQHAMSVAASDVRLRNPTELGLALQDAQIALSYQSFPDSAAVSAVTVYAADSGNLRYLILSVANKNKFYFYRWQPSERNDLTFLRMHEVPEAHYPDLQTKLPALAEPSFGFKYGHGQQSVIEKINVSDLIARSESRGTGVFPWKAVLATASATLSASAFMAHALSEAYYQTAIEPAERIMGEESQRSEIVDLLAPISGQFLGLTLFILLPRFLQKIIIYFGVLYAAHWMLTKYLGMDADDAGVLVAAAAVVQFISGTKIAAKFNGSNRSESRIEMDALKEGQQYWIKKRGESEGEWVTLIRTDFGHGRDSLYVAPPGGGAERVVFYSDLKELTARSEARLLSAEEVAAVKAALSGKIQIGETVLYNGLASLLVDDEKSLQIHDGETLHPEAKNAHPTNAYVLLNFDWAKVWPVVEKLTDGQTSWKAVEAVLNPYLKAALEKFSVGDARWLIEHRQGSRYTKSVIMLFKARSEMRSPPVVLSANGKTVVSWNTYFDLVSLQSVLDALGSLRTISDEDVEKLKKQMRDGKSLVAIVQAGLPGANLVIDRPFVRRFIEKSTPVLFVGRWRYQLNEHETIVFDEAGNEMARSQDARLRRYLENEFLTIFPLLLSQYLRAGANPIAVQQILREPIQHEAVYLQDRIILGARELSVSILRKNGKIKAPHFETENIDEGSTAEQLSLNAGFGLLLSTPQEPAETVAAGLRPVLFLPDHTAMLNDKKNLPRSEMRRASKSAPASPIEMPSLSQASPDFRVVDRSIELTRRAIGELLSQPQITLDEIAELQTKDKITQSLKTWVDSLQELKELQISHPERASHLANRHLEGLISHLAEHGYQNNRLINAWMDALVQFIAKPKWIDPCCTAHWPWELSLSNQGGQQALLALQGRLNELEGRSFLDDYGLAEQEILLEAIYLARVYTDSETALKNQIISEAGKKTSRLQNLALWMVRNPYRGSKKRHSISRHKIFLFYLKNKIGDLHTDHKPALESGKLYLLESRRSEMRELFSVDEIKGFQAFVAAIVHSGVVYPADVEKVTDILNGKGKFERKDRKERLDEAIAYVNSWLDGDEGRGLRRRLITGESAWKTRERIEKDIIGYLKLLKNASQTFYIDKIEPQSLGDLFNSKFQGNEPALKWLLVTEKTTVKNGPNNSIWVEVPQGFEGSPAVFLDAWFERRSAGQSFSELAEKNLIHSVILVGESRPIAEARLVAADVDLFQMVPEQYWGLPIAIDLFADNTGTLTSQHDVPQPENIQAGLEDLLLNPNNRLIVNTGDDARLVRKSQEGLIKALVSNNAAGRWFLTAAGGTEIFGLTEQGELTPAESIVTVPWTIPFKFEMAKAMANAFYDQLKAMKILADLSDAEIESDRARALDMIAAKHAAGWQPEKGEVKNVITYLLPGKLENKAYIYDSGSKMALHGVDGITSLDFYEAVSRQAQKSMAASGFNDIPVHFIPSFNFLDVSAVTKKEGVAAVLKKQTIDRPGHLVLKVAIGDGLNDLPVLNHQFARPNQPEAGFAVVLKQLPEFAPRIQDHVFIANKDHMDGTQEVLDWLNRIQGKTVWQLEVEGGFKLPLQKWVRSEARGKQVVSREPAMTMQAAKTWLAIAKGRIISLADYNRLHSSPAALAEFVFQQTGVKVYMTVLPELRGELERRGHSDYRAAPAKAETHVRPLLLEAEIIYSLLKNNEQGGLALFRLIEEGDQFMLFDASGHLKEKIVNAVMNRSTGLLRIFTRQQLLEKIDASFHIQTVDASKLTEAQNTYLMRSSEWGAGALFLSAESAESIRGPLVLALSEAVTAGDVEALLAITRLINEAAAIEVSAVGSREEAKAFLTKHLGKLQIRGNVWLLSPISALVDKLIAMHELTAVSA